MFENARIRLAQTIAHALTLLPTINKEQRVAKEELTRLIGADIKPNVKKPRNLGKYHNLIKR